LAQSGHAELHCTCPLSGVKRRTSTDSQGTTTIYDASGRKIGSTLLANAAEKAMPRLDETRKRERVGGVKKE
jgi:hypothetical protein